MSSTHYRDAATIGHFVVSSDGAKIYADAAGDPSNPAIVFIHGYQFSGLVWDNLFYNEKYTKKYYLVNKSSPADDI